jgi:adenine-specific DNA-methyltransferase
MPIEYVPYVPQPIEGQAVLANFVRTRRLLSYRDNDKALRRVARGMPRYELETLETVGQPPADGANLVIRGECLSACAHLKERGVKVDLVYIDPPFASGADYAKKIHIRRNPKLAAAMAKAEEELPDKELRSFEEKMYGDIWTKEDYLNWMYENLMAIKAVMSENASIYVHLDWHIGHYVKVLMDEVFGEDSFRNELIWKRTTSRAGSAFYNHIHDTIYFYTRSDRACWNQGYTQYSEEYRDSMFRGADPDGHRWRESPLTAPGIRSGSSGRAWKGVDPNKVGKGRHWNIPSFMRRQLSEAAKEDSVLALDELEKMGRIVWSKGGKGTPNFKQYIDDMEGVEHQSLWTDIGGEEGDYATQKPEALLDRIISASSDEDMVVADFFGGSGVASIVSHRLGRRFIHVDVGLNSVQTARDRLQAAGASFLVLDVKDGVQLFRNPVQTMDKLRSLVTGLRRDEAELDAFWAGAFSDTRLGLVPVYLPDLKDHTSKILDIPLVNRVVGAMQNLPDKVGKVVLFYVDIDDRAAVDAFIEQNAPADCAVELRDLKELLSEVVVADDVSVSVNADHGVAFESFHSDRLQQKIAAYNDKHGLNSFPDGTLLDEDNQPPVPQPVKGFKPIEISEEGLELIEWVAADCTAAEGPWHSDAEIKVDKRGYVVRDGKKTKEFWDATLACPKPPKRIKVRSIAGDETIVAVPAPGSATPPPVGGASSARAKKARSKSPPPSKPQPLAVETALFPSPVP